MKVTKLRRNARTPSSMLVLPSLLAACFSLAACVGDFPPLPDTDAKTNEETADQGESSAPEKPGTEKAPGTTSSTSSTGPSGTADDADSTQETSSSGGDSSGSSDPDSSPDSTGTEPKDDGEAAPHEIQLLISVDWEGGTIRDPNLEAMEKMREDFPKIPLTHFLNAVYYTREGADKAKVTQQIKRVVRDGDEIGIHVHGWQSLFEAAGATYLEGPRYLELKTDGLNDWGYTVDIGAYSVPELRKVLAYSVNLFEEEGFGRAKSFRAGGWMGRSNVLIALVREGFLRDASSVATVHFDDEWFTETPWYGWLTSLWPNIRMQSQPYYKTIQDEDKEQMTILEIPDNGALADYVKPKEMLRVYRACLNYKRTHPGEHVTMNFGFHDINAFRYLERVTEGIKLIQEQAKQDKITIVPVTTESMKVTSVRRP